MDTLSFAIKSFEALAWPIASIVLVLLLRHEIRTLLPYLRRIKAGPVEAEFERGASILKAELLQQPKAAEAIKHTAERSIDGLNPRSEVLEAWLSLEAASNAALAKRQIHQHDTSALSTKPALRNLANTLQSSGLLHQGQVNLFKELQHLRNEVVHTLEFAPTQEAVSRYVETANYLKWWLTEGIE